MIRPDLLNDDQLAVLARFARRHGPQWKDKLMDFWRDGEPWQPEEVPLHSLKRDFSNLPFTAKHLIEWTIENTYVKQAFDHYDGENITVGGTGTSHPIVDIDAETGSAWVQAWVLVKNSTEESA